MFNGIESDSEEDVYYHLTGTINSIYFFIEEHYRYSEDSFWEPVIVCLTQQQIDSLETIICEQQECYICKEDSTIFKKVLCCNNKICTDCTTNWFNRSVYCPFCKGDQRNL